MKYATREQWLEAGVQLLNRDVFTPAGYGLPPGVKVSCSWPGGGSARKRIGECWPRAMSKAGVNEIFISPRIADPVAALDILTHELVHAVDDCQHGHKAPFVAIGRKVGLQGKPTSMNAGEILKTILTSLADDLGPYPHSQLDLSMRKKEKTYLLKHECGECGAVWRMAGKWDVSYCPCCGTQMEGGE